MRRFKLVRTRKRRVEVQKVKLKINFGTLLIAFLFACLVWLYVAGSDAQKPTPPDPVDTATQVTAQDTTADEMVGPMEITTSQVDVADTEVAV